jgi:peptidase inhibitor family I36
MRKRILISAGCHKKLPMAPSDWSTGIIIYEHANYLGQNALVDKDISNLKDYKGPCVESSGSGASETTTNSWKNCVSSIRAAPGWKATLYVDTNFKGKSVEIAADASNMQLAAGDCDHGGFNDCIESVKISRR